MSDFETGKFIGDIIAANAEALFEASKKFVSDKGNQIKARLTGTFSVYLTNIERKYSSTKTIIYRDTPQSIKKFYEPIDLYNDKIDLKNPRASDVVSLGRPLIITGTGGSGKSTFLKYILLNSIEEGKLIPIFVELRIVEQEKKTLINYISDSLQLNKVNLGVDYLKQAFGFGNFIFLLDGFDELSQEFARGISFEIDDMVQEYSKCVFVLTSRPGQDFISWSNFIELKTKPLTVEKSISLISRLNFDGEIKEKFISQLKGSLYDSHRSFFENPLLLSIMLLTYRDSASVPSELHNFYALAFEALYYRHDASKTFKRPTLTNLPVNRGKDVMAAFSLITYINNQTLFSHFELRDYLLKAMQLADCECSIDEFISDLLRAYCMLLQDGTRYQYTHRSFQEYFTACYLVAANDDIQGRLIEQFSQKADTDITLQLSYGMNPKMIEDKLILPFLGKIRSGIGYGDELTEEIFVRFAKQYFDKVSLFSKGLSLSIDISDSEKSASFTEFSHEKSLNLVIMRFVLKLFDIDTNYVDADFDLLASEYPELDGKRVPIDDAFKLHGVLAWFVKNSVEARVVTELMKLENKISEKNKRNTQLFSALLNNVSAKRIN